MIFLQISRAFGYGIIRVPNVSRSVHTKIIPQLGSLNHLFKTCNTNSMVMKGTLQGRRGYSKEMSKEFDEAAYKIHYVHIPLVGSRMKLAALFMQATEGPNNTPEPIKDKQMEHAFWVAWKQLGDMPKKEAEKTYIEQVALFTRKKTGEPNFNL